jgi:hypothetical protein
MSHTIPTVEGYLAERGVVEVAAEPVLAVSTTDFDDDELLDIASDHGTVVETDPYDGILGFVDFSEQGFYDFCRDLITEVRRKDDVGPPSVIHTHMDYIMAVGAFNPLAKVLRATYQGREWPKDDRYVQAFDVLFQAILDFERRNPHFAGPAAQIAGLIRLSDREYDNGSI